MSTPQPPEPPDAPRQGPPSGPWGPPGEPTPDSDPYGYVPVSPLLPEDPPKVADFWLDARLGATPSGVAFTGHDGSGRVAMIILLSEGGGRRRGGA